MYEERKEVKEKIKQERKSNVCVLKDYGIKKKKRKK